MPFHQRFTDLPCEGGDIEGATQDFKVKLDPARRFHLACLVAAFANHLGGSILVGAAEDTKTGRVGKYTGLDPRAAHELQTAFSEAVREFCNPKPDFDFERLDSDVTGNKVLVVFVEAYTGGQPVAVRCTEARVMMADPLDAAKQAPEKHEDPYVFPVRVGKETGYIPTEQLPMFFDPKIRRIFRQLSAIPKDAPVRVEFDHGPARNREATTGGFVRVDEHTNSVHLTLNRHIPLPPRMEGRVFAIDQVRWVHSDGTMWSLLIEA